MLAAVQVVLQVQTIHARTAVVGVEGPDLLHLCYEVIPVPVYMCSTTTQSPRTELQVQT